MSWRKGLVAALIFISTAAAAEPEWVVLETRGTAFKPGQKIPAGTTLALQEGERVLLIRKDGRTLNLRGVFKGVPVLNDAAVDTAREALSALLTRRDDHIKSVGVVRAGLDVATLPDPWLIDASRGGARCLRENTLPRFWRPDASRAMPFSLAPADRTWAVDVAWKAGEKTLLLPPIARVAQQNLVLVTLDGEEFALALHLIPAGVDDGLVLAAWMMEKGCLQQADALLREMSHSLAQ